MLVKSIDKKYKYNLKLTKKLDKFPKNKKEKLDQNFLNEIVLWKVNRYAEIDKKLLTKLNKFRNLKSVEDRDLSNVLNNLLSVDGISLPMATTILRFINPNVFQILDRRAYRVIYDSKTFNKSTFSYVKSPLVRDRQIKKYVDYLEKVKLFANKYKIDFRDSDRVLYNIDKRINGAIK